MNGFATFQTLDGQEITVNADGVRYVKQYQDGQTASIIYFDKDNWILVEGSLARTTQILADA